jgi:amino acid transporter
MILASASIQSGGTFVPQNYQVFLVTTLLMIIHGCISSMPTAFIARFNAVGSTFNMIALFIVIIIIPAGTNRTSQGLSRFNASADVWGEYLYSVRA